jgi:hypothetical protein
LDGSVPLGNAEIQHQFIDARRGGKANEIAVMAVEEQDRF